MTDSPQTAASITKARRLEERGTRRQGQFGWPHKARRACWYLVQATIYQLPVRRADRWRCMLLRLFGARIGRRCMVRRTAFIEIPWHLRIGDDVVLGDRVIVYSLAMITIGDGTIVSQGAHLCAGDHDMDHPDWVLRRNPISIGSNVWIAADAFVGPGVDIGDGVVLGARSAAFRDLPDWTVCLGTPARPHRTRPRPIGVG